MLEHVERYLNEKQLTSKIIGGKTSRRRKEGRNKLALLASFGLLAMLFVVFAAPSYAANGRNIRVDNVKSLNWAGYVVASSFSSPTHVVTMVNGSWILQSVSCSKHGSTYSSEWVGIGGYFSNDGSLIQTGTESDCSNGAATYGIWYELLPNAETPITTITVHPGDVISAKIYLVPNTANEWNITIKDNTNGGSFSRIVTYNSSELSGEWIEERPALCFSAVCMLTTLANFGKAYYGLGYTAIPQTEYATVAGSTLQIGALQNENITMVSSGGSVLASPSPLTYNGTSFIVTYGSGTSTSTHHGNAKGLGVGAGVTGIVH
jgi:hypothetical protein